MDDDAVDDVEVYDDEVDAVELDATDNDRDVADNDHGDTVMDGYPNSVVDDEANHDSKGGCGNEKSSICSCDSKNVFKKGGFHHI